MPQLHGSNWYFDAIEAFNASLTWPRSSANQQAQHVARELNLPSVGGSDAHSITTIGTGFTRFAGTSADDVYHSIKAGQVDYGGQPWTFGQYLEVGWLSIRQRNVWGAIKLACTDLPFFKPRPASGALSSSRSHRHVPLGVLATDRKIHV